MFRCEALPHLINIAKGVYNLVADLEKDECVKLMAIAILGGFPDEPPLCPVWGKAPLVSTQSSISRFTRT